MTSGHGTFVRETLSKEENLGALPRLSDVCCTLEITKAVHVIVRGTSVGNCATWRLLGIGHCQGYIPAYWQGSELGNCAKCPVLSMGCY